MNVRLVPVSDERYREWVDLAVGGMLPSNAAEMLPDVRWIHGQTLRVVRDAERGADVGFVWYGCLDAAPSEARTVHHLVIRRDERGKGYGAAALRAVEEDLRRAGVTRLDLEVSPDNPPALSVCQSSGFEEASIRLRKRI